MRTLALLGAMLASTMGPWASAGTSRWWRWWHIGTHDHDVALGYRRTDKRASCWAVHCIAFYTHGISRSK